MHHGPTCCSGPDTHLGVVPTLCLPPTLPRSSSSDPTTPLVFGGYHYPTHPQAQRGRMTVNAFELCQPGGLHVIAQPSHSGCAD